MNAYYETMPLPADTIDRVEKLCRGPATDCGSDETVFDREVTFDDGCRMAIQVVASNDPAESCWTQGVLFDADGAELGCTEVSESLAGEYVVECDGQRYTATVERTPLRRWAVLYRERAASGGALPAGLSADPPECFMAWAENAKHAEEQCVAAYPGCEVLWTYQGEGAEAYADYWGE